MSKAVEDAYQWRGDRGLEIVKTAILSIEYDADTKALLSDVKKADALSGARGNSFMQQSVARGVQAAGENGGGTGMAFMGMGMQAGAGMMNGMQQPANANQNPFINVAGAATAQPAPEAQPQQVQAEPAQADPYAELKKAKELLDAGIITQEDFEAKKKQLLGI